MRYVKQGQTSQAILSDLGPEETPMAVTAEKTGILFIDCGEDMRKSIGILQIMLTGCMASQVVNSADSNVVELDPDTEYICAQPGPTIGTFEKESEATKSNFEHFGKTMDDALSSLIALSLIHI